MEKCVSEDIEKFESLYIPGRNENGIVVWKIDWQFSKKLKLPFDLAILFLDIVLMWNIKLCIFLFKISFLLISPK